MSKYDQNKAESIRLDIIQLLQGFDEDLRNGDLRDKVLRLAEAFNKLRCLGVAIVPVDDNSARGARNRILLYLRKYAGQVIHGDELLVVSGIQDYPRRVRELRVEFGWPIISGIAIKQMVLEGDYLLPENLKLQTDHYLLLRDAQDQQAAYRWRVANSIRKDKNIGGKHKILTYLLENIGISITGEELRYVANDSTEWARRIRELRTEEGWKIKTKHTGRPDLPQGVYILEDGIPAEKHDRSIPDKIQIEVLERDQFRCIKCGWTHEKMHPDDPRRRLELHHIRHHAKKGENIAENLATLCNVCHDDIHREDKTNSWSLLQFQNWIRR